MKSSVHHWHYFRSFTCVKNEKKELTYRLFHSLTLMSNLYDKTLIWNLHYGPPCSSCSFHCNGSTWCSLEDFLILWADTLLSPDSLLCLSQPWFLHNLTMQLCSSDFTSRYKFKLSCFNKHLLITLFNEIFSQSAILFCLSPQLTIYLCVHGTHLCPFTFLFFILLLFHVSN